MVGVAGDSVGGRLADAGEGEVEGRGKDRDKDKVSKFKRRQRGVALKELLPDLVDVMAGNRGSGKGSGKGSGRVNNRSYDIALIVNWSSIVGEELAYDVLPLGISRRVGGNVLVVACREGRELFMSYRSEQICERINCYFGYALVDRLRFDKRSIESRGVILAVDGVDCGGGLGIDGGLSADFSHRLEIYERMQNLLLHL